MKYFLPKAGREINGKRYLGIDLAKKESQLAVLDKLGNQVCQKRFATTRENILLLANELTEEDLVALEVTTNAISISRLLRDNSSAKLILSNPIKTKLIAQAKVKTDKIDARVLAELARVGYLLEVWLPDRTTEVLRQFFTDRRSLVDRRTELKNTVHSVLHRNLLFANVSDLFGKRGRVWLEEIINEQTPLEIAEFDRLRLGSLLTEIDRQDALIKDQEAVIASFIATNKSLRKQLDLLVSIPGVSLIVGAGIMAAIGNIERFPSPKKLAAYFGVVPSTKQSGDLPARNGRITKQGRSEARWLLVEAAEHLRRSPGPIRAMYQRIRKSKGHNTAVVAVARKLAELIWHLLSKEEEYIYAIPRRTMEKRSKWRFIAKQKVGVELKSATKRAIGRPVLYGTGIEGRKFKKQVVREAARQAERLYEAMLKINQSDKSEEEKDICLKGSDLVFDPTQPKQTDWEKILKDVADRLIREKVKGN